jgi:hypothetical protein
MAMLFLAAKLRQVALKVLPQCFIESYRCQIRQAKILQDIIVVNWNAIYHLQKILFYVWQSARIGLWA